MKEIPAGRPCPHCGYDPDHTVIPEQHLAPGTVLKEQYYIGKVLGEGGFGITYLGFDLVLRRKIAIKEYYPSSLSSRNTLYGNHVVSPSGEKGTYYQSGKQKFIDEARRLAKFQSMPGIVSVHTYFECNNTAYIIMEYIEGQTLRAFVKSKGGRVDPDELLSLMKPALESLKTVHEVGGLIHRDISPDNLIINRNGQIKLLDFGAAREYNSDETKSLSVVFRRGFAPVEQYVSESEQGPWIDIYALCATIYFCITGTTPPESVQRMTGKELIPPSKKGIRIRPNVERALLKGMALQWQQRYQNISDLQKDLYAANASPGQSVPEEDPSNSETIQLLPGSDRNPLPPNNPKPRKSKAPILIGGIVGVLLLCLLLGKGLLSSRSGSGTQIDAGQTADTGVSEDSESNPTATPAQTPTVAPTATIAPTATPTPTATIAPTATPDPATVPDPAAAPGSDSPADPASTEAAEDVPAAGYSVMVFGGTGAGVYAEGETVTVTAEEEQGKKFNCWLISAAGSETVENDNFTFSFIMPATDLIFTALYDIE